MLCVVIETGCPAPSRFHKGEVMANNIEALLTAYERGACSRRHFIAAISALVSVPAIGCAHRQTAAAGAFVPRGINHVTIKVKDLSKSLEFYQRLFKFPHAE